MGIEIELYHRINQDFLLDISCQLPAVQVMGIFGKSGSGKTTLLNMTAGLLHPQKGTIKINNTDWLCTQSGINVPVRNRGIGYAVQHQQLFPHLSVKSNIFYAKRPIAKWLPENTMKVIEELGISHLLDRFPHHLSGGEKQRVSLARTLISSQQLLLLDEPTTGLDKGRKENFFRLFEPYKKNMMPDKAIIFYVSHYLDELIQMADHLMILDQGKVIAVDQKAEMLQKHYRPLGLKNPLNSLTVQALSHDIQNRKTLIQIGTSQLIIPLNQEFLLNQPTHIYIDGSLIHLQNPLFDSNTLGPLSASHLIKGQITKIIPDSLVCRVDININPAMLVKNPSVLQTIIPRYKIADWSLIEGQQVQLLISQMMLENGTMIYC